MFRSPGAGQAPDTESFSPGLRRAVGVIMIGASLSFLDATVVNVALRTLSVDLHAALADVQWVVTGYLLALAAVIPVTGWAARRAGASRLYLGALVLFTAGSGLCALSRSAGALIACRVVQGLGGGAILPAGTMIWTRQATKAQMACRAGPARRQHRRWPPGLSCLRDSFCGPGGSPGRCWMSGCMPAASSPRPRSPRSAWRSPVRRHDPHAAVLPDRPRPDVIVTGLLLAPSGAGALLANRLAAPMTDRLGAGATALAGGLVSVISTVPFVFLGTATPYALLLPAMAMRGLGIGLSIVPAMTAAYRALPPGKIADATPQLNALQRIGGSVGTAALTVVLAHQLRHAASPASTAGAFDTTFIWVTAITAAATAPTLLLVHAERRAQAPHPPASSSAPAQEDPDAVH